MKTLIPVAASIALMALPATAQRTGHSNTNAPTVKQSIDLPENGTVELSYTSITWASGRWAEALENEATRDQMRNTINQAAEQEPLGSFKSSMNLIIGGQQVPAGSYQLKFLLDDEYQWELVLADDDHRSVLGLNFKANPLKSQRLVLAMMAGDEDFTARLLIAFGDKAGELPITVGPAGEMAGFTCPMHPEVKSAEAGKCPRCGMNLVRGKGSLR